MFRENSTTPARRYAKLRVSEAVLVACMLLMSFCLLPCVAWAYGGGVPSGDSSTTGSAMASAESASRHGGKATNAQRNQDKHESVEETKTRRHAGGNVRAVDGIILALVVGAVTAAIKSLAKEGARRCSGNCSACLGGCPAGKDLSQDEKLQAKLRALRQGK